MNGNSRPGPGRAWIIPILFHSVLIQGIAAAARPAFAYALVEADAPTWTIGLLAAFFAVPALLLALPIGRIVDLIGQRVPAVFGAALVTAACVIGLLGRAEVPLMFVASLVLGIGHLPSIVAEQSQVASRSERHRLDANFGFYSFSASIGQLLGPLLLLLPGLHPGMPPLDAVFWGCTIMAVLLTVASLPMLGRTSRVTEDPAEEVSLLRRVGGLLGTRDLVRALLVGALALAVVESVQVFWPAFGVEQGIDVALIGLMLSLRAAASMVSRIGLGWMVHRFGRIRLLIVATIIGGCSLAVTVMPVPIAVALAAASMFGLSVGICQPLSMAWLTSVAPAGSHGVVIALRLAGNRVCQSTIPAAVGSLAAFGGAATVVFVSAGLVTLSALLAIRPREE